MIQNHCLGENYSYENKPFSGSMREKVSKVEAK